LAVARRAGVPYAVVARAEAILAELDGGSARLAPAVPLMLTAFVATEPPPASQPPSLIGAEIYALDLDGVTAREAMEALRRLQDRLAC